MAHLGAVFSRALRGCQATATGTNDYEIKLIHLSNPSP